MDRASKVPKIEGSIFKQNFNLNYRVYCIKTNLAAFQNASRWRQLLVFVPTQIFTISYTANVHGAKKWFPINHMLKKLTPRF